MANTNARGVISFGVAVRGAGALSQALKKANILKQQYSGKRALTIVTKIVGLEKAGKATMRMAKDVAASNTVIGKSSQRATRSVAASVAAISKQGRQTRATRRINRKQAEKLIETTLANREAFAVPTIGGRPAIDLGGTLPGVLKEVADDISRTRGGKRAIKAYRTKGEIDALMRPLDRAFAQVAAGTDISATDLQRAVPRDWRKRIERLGRATRASKDAIGAATSEYAALLRNPTLDRFQRFVADIGRGTTEAPLPGALAKLRQRGDKQLAKALALPEVATQADRFAGAVKSNIEALTFQLNKSVGSTRSVFAAAAKSPQQIAAAAAKDATFYRQQAARAERNINRAAREQQQAPLLPAIAAVRPGVPIGLGAVAGAVPIPEKTDFGTWGRPLSARARRIKQKQEEAKEERLAKETYEREFAKPFQAMETSRERRNRIAQENRTKARQKRAFEKFTNEGKQLYERTGGTLGTMPFGLGGLSLQGLLYGTPLAGLTGRQMLGKLLAPGVAGLGFAPSVPYPSNIAGPVGGLSLQQLFRGQPGRRFGTSRMSGELRNIITNLRNAGIVRPGARLAGMDYDQQIDFFEKMFTGRAGVQDVEKVLRAAKAKVKSKLTRGGSKVSAEDRGFYNAIQRQVEGSLETLYGRGEFLGARPPGIFRRGARAVRGGIGSLYARGIAGVGTLRQNISAALLRGKGAFYSYAPKGTTGIPEPLLAGLTDIPAVKAAYKTTKIPPGLGQLPLSQLVAGSVGKPIPVFEKSGIAGAGLLSGRRLENLYTQLVQGGVLGKGKLAGIGPEEQVAFMQAMRFGRTTGAESEQFLRQAQAEVNRRLRRQGRRAPRGAELDALQRSQLMLARTVGGKVGDVTYTGAFEQIAEPAGPGFIGTIQRARALRQSKQRRTARAEKVRAEREQIEEEEVKQETKTNKQKRQRAKKQQAQQDKAAKETIKGTPLIPAEAGRFRPFFGALQSVAQFAGASAVIFTIANSFREAIAAGVQFEEAMARIQGVLPTRSWGERLEIEQRIVDDARKYGIAIQEAAQSATIFAQQGLRASEIGEQLGATLRATRALGISPEIAREGLTAVRKITEVRKEEQNIIEQTFGRQVSSLEILDRIARVESRRAITSQDILEAIKAAGPLARQLRGDFVGLVDELDIVTGAVTTIVEQTRVSGKQAATSLRFVLARLGRPQVLKQIEQLGGVRLATVESQGRQLRPLVQVLEEISDAYIRIRDSAEGGTAEAAKFLVAVAGARQINAAAALLGNFRQVIDTARLSALAWGDSQQRVGIQLDTFAAKSQRVKTELGIMGKAFIQTSGTAAVFRTILDFLTGGLQLFGKGAEWVEVKMTILIATMSGLLWVIHAVRKALLGSALVKALPALGTAFASPLFYITALAAALTGLGLILSKFKRANAKFDVKFFTPEDVKIEEIPKAQQFSQLADNLFNIPAPELYTIIGKTARTTLDAIIDKTTAAATASGDLAKGINIAADDYKYFRNQVEGAPAFALETFYQALGSTEQGKKVVEVINGVTSAMSEQEAQAYRTQAALTLIGDAAYIQEAVLGSNFNLFQQFLQGLQDEIANTLKTADKLSNYSLPFNTYKQSGISKFFREFFSASGRGITGSTESGLAAATDEYGPYLRALKDGADATELLNVKQHVLANTFYDIGKTTGNIKMGALLADMFGLAESSNLAAEALAELEQAGKDYTAIDLFGAIGSRIIKVLDAEGAEADSLIDKTANVLKQRYLEGADSLRDLELGRFFAGASDPFIQFQTGFNRLLLSVRKRLEEEYKGDNDALVRLGQVWELLSTKVKTAAGTIETGLANVHDPLREILTTFYLNEQAITANVRAATALGLAYDEAGEKLKNIQQVGQKAFGIQEEFYKRTLEAIIKIQDTAITGSDLSVIRGLDEILQSQDFRDLSGASKSILEAPKAFSVGSPLTLQRQTAIVKVLLDRLQEYRDKSGDLLALFNVEDLPEAERLIAGFKGFFDTLESKAKGGVATLQDGKLTLQSFLEIITYLNRQRLLDIIPRATALANLEKATALAKEQTKAQQDVTKAIIDGNVELATRGLRTYETIGVELDRQSKLADLAVRTAGQNYDLKLKELQAQRKIGSISAEQFTKETITARATYERELATAKIAEAKEKELLFTKAIIDEEKRLAELAEKQYETRISGLKEVLSNFESLKSNPFAKILEPLSKDLLGRQVEKLFENSIDPRRGIFKNIGKAIGLFGEEASPAEKITQAFRTGGETSAQATVRAFKTGGATIENAFVVGANNIDSIIVGSFTTGGTEAARLIKAAIDASLGPLSGTEVAAAASTRTTLYEGGAYAQAAGLLRQFEGLPETFPGSGMTRAYWDRNASRTLAQAREDEARARAGDPEAYKYGKWRIGYGSDQITTLTDAGIQIKKVTEGMEISFADAERDLARRIPVFAAVARSANEIGPIFDTFADNIKASLISSYYNYGSFGRRGAAGQEFLRRVRTGIPEEIALAIASLSANPSRRRQEANYVLSGPETAGITLPYTPKYDLATFGKAGGFGALGSYLGSLNPTELAQSLGRGMITQPLTLTPDLITRSISTMEGIRAITPAGEVPLPGGKIDAYQLPVFTRQHEEFKRQTSENIEKWEANWNAMRAAQAQFKQALLELAKSLSIMAGSMLGAVAGGGGRGAQIGSGIGSSIGYAAGSAIPGLGVVGGPLGGLIGGIGGGLIGGLFDSGDKQTTALQIIARASQEQVTLLENTNKLLDLQRISFNLPTGFNLPSYTPLNTAGGVGGPILSSGGYSSSGTVNVGGINIQVTGDTDAKQLASTIRNELEDQLRVSGLTVRR